MDKTVISKLFITVDYKRSAYLEHNLKHKT